jgi:hypothetical protein
MLKRHATAAFTHIKTRMDIGIVPVIRTIISLMHHGTERMNSPRHLVLLSNPIRALYLAMNGSGNNL